MAQVAVCSEIYTNTFIQCGQKAHFLKILKPFGASRNQVDFKRLKRCHCWRHCCRLVHRAATATLHNPHIARAINTWRDQIKTRRKRRKVPSSYIKLAYKEIKLDIYCSVHRNILWNNQHMSQCAVKFYFSASPLYMFRAAHTPIIRSTILTVSTVSKKKDKNHTDTNHNS